MNPPQIVTEVVNPPTYRDLGKEHMEFLNQKVLPILMPAMESLLMRLKSDPESVKDPIHALAQVFNSNFLYLVIV
jgi:hypothetical protein